jgi:2,5-diamino-6-(ribosylamino)-4(3H)-pyrimidinone 5'-phosphate reductase
MALKRPQVTINTAITADGKIDSILRQGAAISSAIDILRMDQLRAESDAVLVGGQTLIYQDPRLTIKTPAFRNARIARGLSPNPIKVGVVSVAKIELNSRFITFGPTRKIIYTTSRTSKEQIERLSAAGVDVYVMGDQRVDLTAAFDSLYNLGVNKLFVEGGGTLIAELFRLDLVDDIILYIGAKIFGGASAPTLVDGPGFLPEDAPQLKLISVEIFDAEGGILVHYKKTS